MALLGGKCADCDEDDPKKLEFDHIESRTWKAAEKPRWVRVALYGREAFDVTEDGRLIATRKIALRCGTCNKRRGPPKLADTGPDPDFYTGD